MNPPRVVIDTNAVLQILLNNKFTDCAIVAQADILVTDDAHFREAAECPFPRVAVVGLDEFANMVRSVGA